MATHQSLHRAVAILREFSEMEPALTVGELSERVGLHKSTVSRILSALLEDGMVWHNTETGRYSLGMAVVEMAGVALGQIDVRAAALPHIESLAADSNETVSVLVPRGREVMTVAHRPSSQPIRHVVWIGRRIPLRTTASGKVILASMHAAGDDWRSTLGVLPEDRTASWEARLRKDLEAITRLGFAEEVDEFEQGTSAVAVPVLDGDGRALAAISVSGPSDRFNGAKRKQIRPRLLEAAGRVATTLGAQRPVGTST
ncbi:MAG TPA: IclR family transcriptional regulator [Acidimicrobiia bacterium]|nr:IclR family transcriptional regulator [Acidimicrobiia bacterium]